MRPTRSLRGTALIWTTILLTVVGAVAAVVSYELARREAAGFLDGQLRQIALNAGEGSSENAGSTADQDPEDEFAIGIWNAAGGSLRATHDAVTLPRQPVVGFSTVNFAGDDWRVFRLDEKSRSVQVAQRMEVRRELAQSAAYQAAVPILVAIPLAWLVIGWSLGRMLGRLTSVAQAIAERGVESKEPISTAGVPAEVGPLVAAMNALIGRLQQALDQQRRFVSDAAHELRTPLTALYLQIENLRAAATKKDFDSAYAELGGGIGRATALIDQLLRMARFELSVESAQRERIDLAGLVTQCVADYVPIASSKGVELGLTASEPAQMWGVPAELKILFGNLIDNAVRYTPQGGSVDVSVGHRGAGAIVEVADTGCGVSESELPRLFDRFFRAAPAHITGTGLGLSIVAAIARRHGLAVNIENRAGGGLIARVVSSGGPPNAAST
jgi:two-component system OmpR family sensor kinase